MNEAQVRKIARAEVALALGHRPSEAKRRCDNCGKPVHIRLGDSGLHWSHDRWPPCTREKGYSGPLATVDGKAIEYTPEALLAALKLIDAPPRVEELQHLVTDVLDDVASRVRSGGRGASDTWYSAGWRDAVDAVRLALQDDARYVW